jgi:Tfp pilus assembly protein PilN
MKNPFKRSEQGSGSFLPQEYVERRAELRGNLLCLALFGVVMFAVVGAFFVTNRQWLTVKRSRDAIASQYAQEAARIEQLKLLEKQKAEIMDKAEVSTALIERVRRSVLLSELANRKPDEVTLLEVSLTGKRFQETPVAQPTGPQPGGGVKNLAGKPSNISTIQVPQAKDKAPDKVMPPRFEHTVKLVGVARTNNDIADYIASLRACTLLDNVDLKYIKETTIEKLELRKFELEAAIRKDADTRGMEVADTGKKPAQGMPGADPSKMRPTPQSKPSVTVVHPKGGD